MKNNQYNPDEPHVNRKLTCRDFTLGELDTYIRLKFGSYKRAGTSAGLSETRVRQILIAYRLPKSPKLIYQIAQGWDIDPVVLTLIFDKYRKSKLDFEQEIEDEN